jgi:hypothetical protein
MTEEQAEHLLETGKVMGIQLGKMDERLRILNEIEKLELGHIWPLIRPIFFPKDQ